MSRAVVQAVSPCPAVESRRQGVRCWPRPLVPLPPWAGRARRSTSAAPPRAAPSSVPSAVGAGPRRWREAPQPGLGRAARVPPPPGPGRTRRCGAPPPRPGSAVPVPSPLGPGRARLRRRGRAAPVHARISAAMLWPAGRERREGGRKEQEKKEEMRKKWRREGNR